MTKFFESNMNFIFDDEKLLLLEKSPLYLRIAKNNKVVDFIAIYETSKQKICFIEAKSSSPNPTNISGFDDYINEISKKFIDSLNIYTSYFLGRQKDHNSSIKPIFRSLNYSEAKIKLILVIRGHKEDWLEPIKYALLNTLQPFLRIWDINDMDLLVLNDSLAIDYKYIVSE